jgi:hypothetical protein
VFPGQSAEDAPSGSHDRLPFSWTQKRERAQADATSMAAMRGTEPSSSGRMTPRSS